MNLSHVEDIDFDVALDGDVDEIGTIVGNVDGIEGLVLVLLWLVDISVNLKDKNNHKQWYKSEYI